ncbi:MAG: hypothetical protein VB858_15745 [Planctomycetaceae bacterium]
MRPLYSAIVISIVMLSPSVRLAAADFRSDVVFANRDGRELKLCIALPDGDQSMRPAMVCIHGGGWRSGNRGAYQTFSWRFRELSRQPLNIV